MKLSSPDKFKILPDAILFDLDNTLYDYTSAHQSASDAVKNKMVQIFSMPPEDFDTMIVEAKTYTKERLNGTASSHSRLLYFQRMLELMGMGSQILHALDLEQTYWRAFLARATLFEGVRELLEEIRLLDIPIAIVTDLTAQIQFRKMLYFNLDDYFDCIITSEEAGCEKPCETIFKLALDKLQIQENAQVWMIGDNPLKDIKGARDTIQATTVQKVHQGVAYDQADASFNQYAELIQLIAKLSKES